MEDTPKMDATNKEDLTDKNQSPRFPSPPFVIDDQKVPLQNSFKRDDDTPKFSSSHRFGSKTETAKEEEKDIVHDISQDIEILGAISK